MVSAGCFEQDRAIHGKNQFDPLGVSPENGLGPVMIEDPKPHEHITVGSVARIRHLLSILADPANGCAIHTGPMSESNALNTLSHFAINVEDSDRARAFYEAVFGWKFEAWGPPGFYMSQVGNLKASLQKRQDEPFPTVIGNFECSISVDDVDRVVELILAHGGEVTLAKVTIPSVCDIARVKDCEGNTFSICRYHF